MDPLSQIRFVQHATVCIDTKDAVVYVDPYRLNDDPHDADLVIVTHAHHDHYSPEDIEKVRKADTCFVTTPSLAHTIRAEFSLDDAYLSEFSYDSPTLYFECGVMLTPTVAENKNHPVDAGFGVVVEAGGARYYMSGDTDTLATDVVCDVLFVACDGIYNMPQFETRIPAAILAMDHMPGIVIPYHYAFPGAEENAAKLCAALQAVNIPCREWN